MMPDKRGHQPAYEQKNFTEAEKRGKLRLVASPDGREGSVKIRQDNDLYATVLSAGDSVEHLLKPERHAYVQVARGSVKLNGKPLETGDGAAISAEKSLELTGVDDAEILVGPCKAGLIAGRRASPLLLYTENKKASPRELPSCLVRSVDDDCLPVGALEFAHEAC